MDEPVKVESITLDKLFEKKLSIPEYQRPYVWTIKEIDKLLYQINEHNERTCEKPNFYLGSIVLHYDELKECYHIIDGQQRITTLQILDLVKNNKTYNIEYNHPITIKNIKENYHALEKKKDKIDALNFDTINVTIVITDNEDMAYNFFETLNTGGKRLGGTDILKAHHLRCISNNDERNLYAFNWEKNQKNLEIVNRMLSKIRRMDYLNKHSFIPDKFSNDGIWKNVLTEDFADKVKKDIRDIGYSFVEIEENTHTITADKYAIRQPLNNGINYINYLISFTNDYNFLFTFEKEKNDKYTKFNNEIINVIDGTSDIKFYYQLALLCFVDRFGRKNVLEFSLYLFRLIYSIRLKDQSKIYEATVFNFVNETKILEKILNAFTYEDLLISIKNTEIKINTINLQGVKARYFNRVNQFFGNIITTENFDERLLKAITDYLKN